MIIEHQSIIFYTVSLLKILLQKEEPKVDEVKILRMNREIFKYITGLNDNKLNKLDLDSVNAAVETVGQGVFAAPAPTPQPKVRMSVAFGNAPILHQQIRPESAPPALTSTKEEKIWRKENV